MTTSGCVRATVVGTFSYNFRVVVPAKCVADGSDLSHKVGLLDIHMKFGDVLRLRAVLRNLERISTRELEEKSISDDKRDSSGMWMAWGERYLFTRFLIGFCGNLWVNGRKNPS
jgi:hypothetical protein